MEERMIKMIVADDEPVIIAGIRKLVDWEAQGIEIVGQYTDGRSALEGIMKYQPQLVLLDISMPEMSGVEVLKECYLLGIKSKIILISGFQDFEYAKAGISYGAVAYLLKPVIREELLHAIDKCINRWREEPGHDMMALKEDGEEFFGDTSAKAPGFLEEGEYLPVYVEIFAQEESPQMKKLLHFSVFSFIEDYLERHQMGIVFHKRNDIVIVLKGMSQEEGRSAVITLRERLYEKLGVSIGRVIGITVGHMSGIPLDYERCLSLQEYFYFADQMELPVLQEGKPAFAPVSGNEAFLRRQGQLIDAVIAQDTEGVEKHFEQLVKLLCRMADGKKEDACFYLCSTARALEEKFKNLSMPSPGYDEKELLQKSRSCRNYRELQEVFHGILREYLQMLSDTISSHVNQDFLKAKVYIDQHYAENLTLEVLAKEIHMNPYYFSSFFKKNAGENFKDYVNRVRIRHAVSLLVSSDMKVYEIATKVGFGDARVFSENFQRVYHETPNSYRKRAGGAGDKKK